MTELTQAGNSIHVFYNNEGVWDDSPGFIKDPERAFAEGRTHWWIVDEANLRLCDEIFVHRPGLVVFKAQVDHDRCTRRESDGRMEIAFFNPERVNQTFEWANQNPVRYNAFTRTPLAKPSKPRIGVSQRTFRLTDERIRDAIKKTGLSKLRKPADMVKLVSEVAQKRPTNEQELSLAARDVCERYTSGKP